MTLDSIFSATSRVFFGVSFLLLAISVIEKGLNLLGFTILGASFAPSRLLEWAVLLLIFVILRIVLEEIPLGDG